MKKTRRIKTTIKQRELIIIRGARARKSPLCHECAEAISLVRLDEAVQISGISSRAVYRLIEGGRIHFAEMADGMALICPATLLRQTSEESSG